MGQDQLARSKKVLGLIPGSGQDLSPVGAGTPTREICNLSETSMVT